MKHDSPERNRADKLATGVQRLGVAGGFFRLVRTLGLAALLLGLAVFSLYIRMPRYIGAGLIIIAAGIVVLDVIVLKRTAAVDLHAPPESDTGEVELEPDEILVESIPAVMQCKRQRERHEGKRETRD